MPERRRRLFRITGCCTASTAFQQPGQLGLKLQGTNGMAVLHGMQGDWGSSPHGFIRKRRGLSGRLEETLVALSRRRSSARCRECSVSVQGCADGCRLHFLQPAFREQQQQNASHEHHGVVVIPGDIIRYQPLPPRVPLVNKP